MRSALEVYNRQSIQNHVEKLSDYEQTMLQLEATRKQLEDDLAAHKDEISSHKEAISKYQCDLDDHKDKMSTYESEIEALKKHRDDLEAEMMRKAAEYEAEIARHIDDRKKTLEEHTDRIQSDNLQMLNKMKAEHDAEMKKLQEAEGKVEELLSRVVEKEQEMHMALELSNSQLKTERAEKKQLEDDLVSKLSTYESETNELKKHREILEAEMKRKVAEHEEEAARHIDDHKETLEEHTQRIQRENMEMMSKIKAEHDAEMKRLHDAEAKVEELEESVHQLLSF
jgi:chromosome segregation ATPase